MKDYTAVSSLLLTLFIALANGKKCFQCQDLPHPSDCRRIVECPATDNCYVDEIVTGGGVVLFNSGCRPTERCRDARKRDIVARGDILACEACCTDDLCNLQGCGKAAPSRNTRGPFCFSCDAQTSETNCRNVALCATDQTCVIAYNDIDKFYTTGCIQNTQCQAILSQVQPIPIGRRRTFQFTTCGTCCNDDFCNVNCTKLLMPVDGHWSVWGQWTGCSVTCGQGVKQRHRQCNNPTPQNHGNICAGSNLTTVTCNATHVCALSAINGHWSIWGDWSGCSVSCGQGFRQRHRLCNNPMPQNHGNNCFGSSYLSEACTANKCETCRYNGYVWVNTSDGHGCLKLYKELVGWKMGRQKCHWDGAELFVANIQSKQALMTGFLRQQNMHNISVWIGLSTTGGTSTWQWVGQRPTNMSYNNFYNTGDGTPSPFGNQCAAAKVYNIQCYWYPEKCYDHHNYVLCEMKH